MGIPIIQYHMLWWFSNVWIFPAPNGKNIGWYQKPTVFHGDYDFWTGIFSSNFAAVAPEIGWFNEELGLVQTMLGWINKDMSMSQLLWINVEVQWEKKHWLWSYWWVINQKCFWSLKDSTKRHIIICNHI